MQIIRDEVCKGFESLSLHAKQAVTLANVSIANVSDKQNMSTYIGFC